MGCQFSKKQKTPSNYIRVVQMNGHVEDFYYPLTAGEVTGKPPTQFLCTQTQLMSGYLKPLKADTQLEPSQVYFMLSYSTIQSESSPIDIVLLAKRLFKLAKTSPPNLPSSNSSSTSCTSLSQTGQRSTLPEFGKVRSCRASESWKPMLDTIRESSFHRKKGIGFKRNEFGDHNMKL